MTAQTSNPDRKVPTRRISFEESLQSVPRHFAADGDLIQSHLAASLSAVFPDGEDFFVRSVRNFRDEVRNLFMWHALEESEHKAVAFDVYKAVDGSERLRTFTMNLLTVGFIGGMALQVGISLLTDKATFKRGNLRKSWRKIRRSPI